MTGMFHDFLLSFPWSITLILGISLLVASLLVPFMQFWFIRKPLQTGGKGFSFLDILQKYYNKLLDVCFKHPYYTVITGLAFIFVGIILMGKLPQNLMPTADRNQFAVEIYLPTGTAIEKTSAIADTLENILRADDRIVSVTSFTGCASPRFHTAYAPQIAGPNYAQFIVNTKGNKEHVYSLDECIEAALDNNVRMKNAQNNLRMAEHSKQEAFSKYFPTVSAMGSGFLADKSLVRMGLSPEMQMTFMKNGLVGDVSATLPLFTGGQIINGNKLAKVNVEVNRLQQRQSQNEVTLTVENYFWQVVMLKEKLQTISTLDKQLTQLLQDVETSVQAGVTTRNDLLQVQLRQNEIQSKRIQAENMLSLSRSMLAQYIGHPADSIEVAATLKDTLPQGPEGLYTPPEAALATTNEYNLLQQNVKASSLQHKMAIGKNLLTIAIGGGYAYENLLGKDHTFWLGFATVSVPISGWWGGSHDIQRQKLQLRNAENQLADQSQLLVIRMKHIWDDLNDAYKQVKIALLSIEQAKENLRLNTDYYAAGTCTMSDLLDAQSLYQQSRDKYVETYAQYEVKKREYLQVTGR